MGRDYKEYLTMRFEVGALDGIILALLDNALNRKFVTNVARLFDQFSPATYSTDYNKEFRVHLIVNITNLILDRGLTDRNIILSNIDTSGKFGEDYIALLNNLSEQELSEEELLMLDSRVSRYLKYGLTMEKSTELIDKLQLLASDQYDDLDVEMMTIENEIDTLNKSIKSANATIEDSRGDMNLNDPIFIKSLGNIINKEKNPASKVKMGLQYMNTMLLGGFEKQRVYVALGCAKSWKSGLLLNCALMARRYNTFVTSDPKLRPVVLYLTLENSTDETMLRVWNHCFGDSDLIQNHTPEEAYQMLANTGLIGTNPNDVTTPELLIWYRANRSISTADIATMLEDLKKEGKECVFLVLDYIKRVRPAEANKELRLELGNITNELKNIAIEYNIPILTAQQLNRDAFRTLENAETFDEKVRMSDKLGVSNVSESIDVIQNADCSFIVNLLINKQYDQDGNLEIDDRYEFIKMISTRMKQPAVTSFKHRFMTNNGMRLIEDINMGRPVSTITDAELIKERTNGNTRTSGPRTVYTKQ